METGTYEVEGTRDARGTLGSAEGSPAPAIEAGRRARARWVCTRSGAKSGPEEDWLEVMERLRAGDLDAFARVCSLIVALLHRRGAYALRESWDDICQEVLFCLARKIEQGRLREPRAFVAYAYALTRSCVFDFIHRRIRITSGGRRNELGLRSTLDGSDSWPGRVQDPDLCLDLEQALSRLPPRMYRVIEGIYLLGRSYREVAQELGLPLGTVKRLQTQGLRQLRGMLREDTTDLGCVPLARLSLSA